MPDLERYARALQAALQDCGLKAVIGAGRSTVTAKNPAVAGEGVQGALLCPGLVQTVVLRLHDDGQWWWCWAWSAPARGAPPEYEPLRPAAEVAEAARRIANVLAVREPEPSGRSASSDARAGVPPVAAPEAGGTPPPAVPPPEPAGEWGPARRPASGGRIP